MKTSELRKRLVSIAPYALDGLADELAAEVIKLREALAEASKWIDVGECGWRIVNNNRDLLTEHDE